VIDVPKPTIRYYAAVPKQWTTLMGSGE